MWKEKVSNGKNRRLTPLENFLSRYHGRAERKTRIAEEFIVKSDLPILFDVPARSRLATASKLSQFIDQLPDVSDKAKIIRNKVSSLFRGVTVRAGSLNSSPPCTESAQMHDRFSFVRHKTRVQRAVTPI